MKKPDVVLTNMTKKIILTLLFVVIASGSFSQSLESNCPNSDFSLGNFADWGAYYGDFYDPAKYVGFVENRHVINSVPGEFDPFTCGGLVTIPPGETHSARLGNANVGAEAEQLRYSLTVTPETNLFIYKYAVVLEDPSHIPENQPSFTIEVIDENGQLVDPVCGYYYVYAQQGLPGWSTCGNVVWKDWTTVGLNLDAYMGENVTIVFTTRDCEQTGHFGYAYLSAYCEKLEMLVSYCPQSAAATLSAPPGFTYLWENGQTTQSIEITAPPAGSSESCILTAVNGCQVTISATLNPTIVNADFENTHGCSTLPVYFDDASTINQNEIAGWHWDFDDGSPPVTNTPEPAHSFGSPGTFNVELIAFSTEGCSDTIVKPVIIYPKPYADFSITNQCLGQPTRFTDQSSIQQSSITNWYWDFGDGSTPISGISNPNHHFSSPGTYSVELITSTDDGCSDNTIKPVSVYAAPEIDFYQNSKLITSDPTVLCPLDSTVNLSAGNNGIDFVWTKKSQPDWSSNSPSIRISNPGMGVFIETYFLELTNENNCSSIDSLHLLWDFSGCEGYEDDDEKNTVRIFPNPADDKLNVVLPEYFSQTKIELFDMLGKKIFSREYIDTNSDKIVLALEHYHSGIYYLRIIYDNVVETRKIILK